MVIERIAVRRRCPGGVGQPDLGQTFRQQLRQHGEISREPRLAGARGIRGSLVGTTQPRGQPSHADADNEAGGDAADEGYGK